MNDKELELDLARTESYSRMPVEEDESTDYKVTVNGNPVFVHYARVSAYPVNQVFRDYQRPLDQTEISSFSSWDMIGPVKIEVTTRCPVHSVKIRPYSSGIKPCLDGDTIHFTISHTGQYTVEVNDYHNVLHLFANPPEERAPDQNNPDVLYFGAGVHCPGIIRLHSGQTIYLADVAIVYGAILSEHSENIVIRGRGILDGSKFNRYDITGLVCLYDCKNVNIEGITIRDSAVFNFAIIASSQIHIKLVKIVGQWRYNTDGIDFINCQSCSVEDSFIRTFDDSLCIKGYKSFGPFLYRLRTVNGLIKQPYSVDGIEGTFSELQQRFGCYPCPSDMCHDIKFIRCVIWCDWGRAMEIGAETVAHEIKDILFENCDLIHCSGIAMDLQNLDRALCHHIVFQDIRVEMDDEFPKPVMVKNKGQSYKALYDGYLPKLFVIDIKEGYVSHDTERGYVEDICLKNISVSAAKMPIIQLAGYDNKHQVKHVLIENIRLNGQPIMDLVTCNIVTNEFVQDIELIKEE
jgi:hypothetical protein